MCLHADPNKRPSAAEFLDLMSRTCGTLVAKGTTTSEVLPLP
jgi:hypothetical protein